MPLPNTPVPDEEKERFRRDPVLMQKRYDDLTGALEVTAIRAFGSLENAPEEVRGEFDAIETLYGVGYRFDE